MKRFSWRRVLNFLVQIALYSLITVFLIDSLARGWDQVKAYPWQYDIPLLALAVFLVLLNVVGQAILWTWAIRRMDLMLPYRDGVRIFLTSQLAKYIPGGVWSFANVAYSARKIDLPGSLLTLMFVLSTLLMVAANAVFAIPILPQLFPEFPVSLDLLMILGLALAIVLGPFVLRIALKRIAEWRKLDAEAIQCDRITGYSSMLFMFLVVLCLHAFNLLSVALFMQSSIEITWADSIRAALAWNSAWLAGFLFLIAPSGLGVREYVLVLLLQPIMPRSIATVISVLHRLFMTMVDLILLLLVGLERFQESGSRLRTNSRYPSE